MSEYPQGFFNLRLSNGKTALCCGCQICRATYFEVTEDFRLCEHVKEPRGWDKLPEIQSQYGDKKENQ